MCKDKIKRNEIWLGANEYVHEQFQLFRKMINFIKEVETHETQLKLKNEELEYLGECLFNHNYEAIKKWKKINAVRMESARILRVQEGTRNFFRLKKEGKL